MLPGPGQVKFQNFDLCEMSSRFVTLAHKASTASAEQRSDVRCLITTASHERVTRLVETNVQNPRHENVKGSQDTKMCFKQADCGFIWLRVQ
jgi:hypothetical protein